MRRIDYTPEEDDFIRKNYSNVGECTRLLNERFGTNRTYQAVKCHAMRALGLRTGLRPWTKEMNESLSAILSKHSYRDSTRIFNEKWGTAFTQKQIQDHCTRGGIKRRYSEFLAEVDRIVADNIDKTYEEIRLIIKERTGMEYRRASCVVRRANKMGLTRPHRVWSTNDRRTINGEQVTYSEWIRFIGNRWHRLSPELQPMAMQVVRLQAMTQTENKEDV